MSIFPTVFWFPGKYINCPTYLNNIIKLWITYWLFQFYVCVSLPITIFWRFFLDKKRRKENLLFFFKWPTLFYLYSKKQFLTISKDDPNIFSQTKNLHWRWGDCKWSVNRFWWHIIKSNSTFNWYHTYMCKSSTWTLSFKFCFVY